MERFTVNTEDGSSYMVYLRYDGDKVVYSVHIGRYIVSFMGNPNWDTLGAFIVPINPPVDIDPGLLAEIADKIDDFKL